jgi:hypothetical protein
VSISLVNNGNVPYTVPAACWFLRFYKPDGQLFAPPNLPCDDGESTSILAPGGRLDVFTGWKLDECTQFGPEYTCPVSQLLPAGIVRVDGAIWSQDRQSYAEFSATYTISAQIQPPTPSPTPASPVELPNGGGRQAVPPGAGQRHAASADASPGAQPHGGQPGPAPNVVQPRAQADGGPGVLAIGAVLAMLGALSLVGVACATGRRAVNEGKRVRPE